MKKVALVLSVAIIGMSFHSNAQTQKSTTEPVVSNPGREITTIDPNKGDFLWDEYKNGQPKSFFRILTDRYRSSTSTQTQRRTAK